MLTCQIRAQASAGQENLRLIAQIVAPDEDALFIGSGADERIRITAAYVDIHLLAGGQAA